MMDRILAELRASLADLAPKAPRIPIITTVENAAATPAFDADHWVANVRNPVRFRHAIASAGTGHTTFIEVSPHPMLTKAVSDTLGGTHHHSLGTLQRDTHDTLTFHTNLNAAHTTEPPHTDHPAEPHPAIPTTPWHHSHHWIQAAPVSAPKRFHTNGSGVNGVRGPSTGEVDHIVPTEWLYEPTWSARPLPAAGTAVEGPWLVLADDDLGAELRRVIDAGVTVLSPTAVERDADQRALVDAVGTAANVVYAPAATGAGVDVASAYRLFHVARRLAAALATLPAPPACSS